MVAQQYPIIPRITAAGIGRGYYFLLAAKLIASPATTRLQLFSNFSL